MEYKLLTPGLLTTTMAVKEQMLFDHYTWDDDYKQITCRICDGLLRLGHVSAPEYTAVLMQGSGTFGVESVLTSVIGADEKVLVAANGAYGLRMTDICRHAGIACTLYEQPNTLQPDAAHIAELLTADPSITHVSMVHSETTSGILNDIEEVGKIVKAAGKTCIVGAMSSFGGVDIPVADYGIDFLISSANKCIQGVPGFVFILARREKLEQSRGKARSLSLDLYEQWKSMNTDGKWRFTSPTHAVMAFAKAMEELEQEGGISVRHARYVANQRLLALRFGEMGFKPYLDPSVQAVVKVGDTVSDIQEGRNAGVRLLGVLEGSSVMGMTLMAYEALSADEKQAALDRARQVFLEAGADDVLLNIKQLPAWIQAND